MNKEDKLKKIKQTFDDAEEAIEEITVNEEGNTDITLHASAYEMEDDFDVGEADLTEEGNVFELVQLKKDFMIVRRNLLKLINKGQRLMDQASQMDMEDMKGIQIMAISQLSNSVTNNLKLLVEIYKDITDIEKNRKPQQESGNTIYAESVNQNTLYIGDSNDLIDYLNQKKKDS